MINLQVIRPAECEHGIIHRREDRFAAWPFNCGMWKFAGDEIVVGFVSRLCTYTHGYEVAHGYDPRDGKPSIYLSRSLDGGQNWKETPLSVEKDLEFQHRAGMPLPSEAPVDFTDPDVLVMHRSSWVAVSTDRGRTFGTLAMLPACRHNRIMGRPDCVIRPDGACVVLTTLSLDRSPGPPAIQHGLVQNLGAEGRPACYISRNGGESWEFLSYMCPFPTDYIMIMPSGVWLPSGRMLAAVRCIQYSHGYSFWTELFASDDAGRTWRFFGRLNDLGAPCHLLLLNDGRVLGVYGYRSKPFGIRARVSEDGGETWGPEIVLRDDGGCWDLGYPRSCQLDNGDIFTAYYFNDRDDPIDAEGKGGVRYIASTRWRV